MRLLGLIDFSVLSYRYKIYKNIDRNGYKEVIKMDNEKEQIINYWVNKDKTSTHMEPEKLLKHIENFIKEHNTCALATSANDIVRCTPIEYNYIDGNFYLLSEGGRKFRGLYTNENVSLAIYESYQGFGELAGMQIMGKTQIIEPFSDEYNKVLEYKKIPRTAIEKMPYPMNLIKVIPTEIDFLNSKFKEEGCDSRQHLNLPLEDAQSSICFKNTDCISLPVEDEQ